MDEPVCEFCGAFFRESAGTWHSASCPARRSIETLHAETPVANILKEARELLEALELLYADLIPSSLEEDADEVQRQYRHLLALCGTMVDFYAQCRPPRRDLRSPKKKGARKK